MPVSTETFPESDLKHYRPVAIPSAPASAASSRLASFAKRHSAIIFLVLVAIGSLRIASTWTVFSHTWDEPNHIASGTEWIEEGRFHFDYSHPPLARVAAAIGPWLADGRKTHFLPDPKTLPLASVWDDASVAGLAILHHGGNYDRTLALARLGMLPFFWIASVVVYLWSKRYLGELAAALAVFFFTFLPPILAHAGLATTDMALTAFAGAAFLMTFVWIENPTLPKTLLLGVIAGLAMLSKFSALPFIPVALAAAAIANTIAGIRARQGESREKKSRNYFGPGCLAAVTALLVIWAGYRFSFGMMGDPGFTFPVPAPDFFTGIRNLLFYNSVGHPSFLLGNFSKTGWWYFFPVTLAVKTPIPFLALTVFGAIAALKGSKGVRLALAFSLGILCFALTARINLGVRHVLPVYMGFSIVAAAGAERLLSLSRHRKWPAWVLGASLFWMTATSVLSHPDYLPYFNAFAGSKPENVLVDSDLDWGQDMKRLVTALRSAKAPSVTFSSYLPEDFDAMGFPQVTPGKATASTPGWNAVSLTKLKLTESEFGTKGAKPLLESIPAPEKIGKGMLLWYTPPVTAQPQ